MKFTCKQQPLLKALNIVSKAITTRTTMPILKGILINIEGEKLTLASSDLDLSIEKTVEVEDTQNGATVVQAKLFMDIIRKLPNEDILIEEQEDNIILIKGSTSEFKIIGLPADEFPAIQDIEGEYEQFSFDKQVLKDMIRKTSFAASIDESKGVIIGILMELKQNALNMVALDGFRMAVVREEIENTAEKKIIIAARIMNEIVKIISETEDEGDMALFLGEKKAIARLDGTKVAMRLLEGEFIKYKEIIPKEHKCKVRVAKGELFDSIERASLFAREGKNNLIKFSIQDGLIVITSRSEEGNVREEVYTSKEGIDLDIGFNSKYVLDVLKAIDDEEITIEFNASVNPCLVKPVEGNQYEYLILPVRINNTL